jgi:hypothetical protein|tara:strand:- start:375 stop:839 length:465 start_codon:yes stop_codon:yes gene_type:complete
MEYFNNMDDESFRKEFLDFIRQHQKKMNEFMKKMYGSENENKQRINYNQDDLFNKIIKRLNDESNKSDIDDQPFWEKTTWYSPEENSMYTSFSRDYNPYASQKNNVNNDNTRGENNLPTIELLNEKLNKSILTEDYESAAKIRDLIKSFKEGNS